MSGQIGVLGGLIQDRLDNQSDGLPGLGMLDGIGRLFSHKTDRLVRTELVVFCAPPWWNTLLCMAGIWPGWRRTARCRVFSGSER